VLTGRANASNFELSQSTCQQWQLSNGSGGFTNIPGAIGPSVMLFAPASDTHVRFVASGPGTNVTYTTTVHSSPDNKAPAIIAVNSLNGTNINVTYNERVESSSATDPFNYTINGGTIVIGGIFQWPDQRNITITVDTNYGVLTSPFSVEAANIADLSPGPNFGSSSAQGIIKNYFAADVGAPLAGGSSFSTSDDSFDVIAGGNDIWGNSDVGHLTLRQISGNFDIHARVAGLTWADAIGKAGLMVRETTDANSRTLYTALNPPQFQPPGGFNPTGIPGRDLGEAGHRYAIGGTTAGWSTRPESQALIQQGGNSAFNPPAMPNAWVRITRVAMSSPLCAAMTA